MAEGGRSLEDPVDGNDFVYDYPCSTCEKDNRNVEAVKYCVDCDENLCSTCLSQHNKFPLMRRHKVLDQVERCHRKEKNLPSERCSKHGGKIIDIFCPNHDVVGCSTCINLDHGSCGGKKFIPDVANGIKTSQELKQLEADMNNVKSRLDLLKEQKRANSKRLKQDKDELKEQIRLVRQKLNDRLDQMEEELLDETENRFKQKIEAINNQIAMVDTTLTQLDETMKQIKADSQDSDIFIACKVGKKDFQDEYYPKMNEYEAFPHELSLELEPDETIKLILEGERIFATMMDKYVIEMIEYKEERNVRLSDDTKVCLILSVCPLPDNCLAMADFNNKKIKKWDPVSDTLSSLIDFSDEPVSQCLVDNTRLAVSLHLTKKIQFVSLGNQVTLGNSFSVGDACRGLAHCDGLLYVCCGGSDVQKEGRGHVEIYNLNGELLQCFYEEVQCPFSISVINVGNAKTVFLSDFVKGVQVRGNDGVIKHRFSTILNSELPFCLIGNKHVCIGENSSRDIYLHSFNNRQSLVKNVDSQHGPASLYFGEKSARLIVTLLNCDKIKVFDVKMED